MDRYYEDISLPPRGFSYSRPPPLLGNVIPKPPVQHENFSRFPVVGNNSPYHSTGYNPIHYGKFRSSENRFQNHSPPRNFQRSHYSRFNMEGNHSRANFHPIINQYQARYAFNNPVNKFHPVFQGDLRHSPKLQDCQYEAYSNRNQSSEQDKQIDTEAIKKAKLAAKLKKSLESFQKNPSYKEKNLSIINKIDATRGSSKYTTEIKPCFRWDLPLTVDDLKTIRRCPSGNTCDDQPNPQDDVSIIERREYSFNSNRPATSPDIIYVKRCRKRKFSESMECSGSKRGLFNHRRRHHSASPKLCVVDSDATVHEQHPMPSVSHVDRETTNESPLLVRTDGYSPSKGKPSQSSNVMKLLGVKRREFDELVNQPRSPRVQFMLGLLMKRHKELLLQRAMRSRISNVPNEEGAGTQSEEPVVDSVVDSPSETNTPIELERMGASDTIDQLSNILLESSLAVDISSLPQELIDQLGTFLELGADSATHHGNVDKCSDREPNTSMDASGQQGVVEKSMNLAGNAFVMNEVGSHVTVRCDSDVNKTRRIDSEGSISQIERTSENSHAFIPGRQNTGTVKRGTLCEDEIDISGNSQNSGCHVRGRDIPVHREESSLHAPHMHGEKNVHTVVEPQENYERNIDQHSHPASFNPHIADHGSSNEIEDDIIAKLWSIDARIFELMEEKKLLYQKLWTNKGKSNINTSISTKPQSNKTTMAPSFERAQCVPNLPTRSLYSLKSLLAPVSDVSCVTNVESSVTEYQDKACHSIQSYSNSKPSDNHGQKAHVVESETIQLPISSKSTEVPCSQRHDSNRRCENRDLNNCSMSDKVHQEVRTADVSIPLGNFSPEGSNSKRVVVESVQTNSKPAELFNQDAVVVESDMTRLPISPKLTQGTNFLRHDNKRRKFEPKGGSCSSVPDHFCRQTQTANINMLDGSGATCSDTNSKSVPMDSMPKSEPIDVDSDPDILEDIDEPIEIVYDSNVPGASEEKNEGELIGHKDAVLAVKAAGNYLFACCADYCVYCYDIRTYQLIQTYKGHTEKVTCLHVDLSGNNLHLYSGSHDRKLRRYRIKEGTLQRTKTLSDPIQCMGVGWGFLFLGTKRGKIERYNLKNGDFAKGLSSIENEIMAIQTSKEGPRQVLIVACRNMPMIVRDAFTGLLLRTINEDMLKHTTYSLCENQGLVYAGTSIYGVAAVDFTSGKVVQKYTGCGSVVSIKVNGDKVFAASYDGKIYVYDLGCSSPSIIIDASTRMLLCMDQKDDKIFAGSVSGQLKFWKMP